MSTPDQTGGAKARDPNATPRTDSIAAFGEHAVWTPFARILERELNHALIRQSYAEKHAEGADLGKVLNRLWHDYPQVSDDHFRYKMVRLDSVLNLLRSPAHPQGSAATGLREVVFATLKEVEDLEESATNTFDGPDAEPSARQRVLAELHGMLEHRLKATPEPSGAQQCGPSDTEMRMSQTQREAFTLTKEWGEIRVVRVEMCESIERERDEAQKALGQIRDTAIAMDDSLRVMKPTGGSAILHEGPARIKDHANAILLKQHWPDMAEACAQRAATPGEQGTESGGKGGVS